MYKNLIIWVISVIIHLGIAFYSLNVGYEIGKKQMMDKFLILTSQYKSLKEA